MAIQDRGLLVRIGANDEQFQKILTKTQRDLNKVARKMKRTGKKLSRNITAPLGIMAGAAIKTAADFETSMTKIETLVGLSRKQVNGMKGDVLALAKESGRGPKELADALFTVTSAGARGAEAMEILERSAKASAVGLGETKQIAQAVTGVMASYKDSGLTAAQATDQLTAIVREGNLEAESLAPVLGRVTGLASQMGVSFGEVGANIATFTRLGVSAEEATTGLRGILNSLLKTTPAQEKAFEALGTSADQVRKKVGTDGLSATLADLIKRADGNTTVLGELIPNVRALSNVLGTAGAQGKDYAQIAANIQNANGLVDKGFQRTSETIGFKFNQALQNLQTVAVEMGAKLIPTVTKVIDVISDLLDWFGALSDTTKNWILIAAGIAAALGPTLTFLGTLGTAFMALMSPITLVIGAVAGVIAIGKNLYDNWDTIAAELETLWMGIKLVWKKAAKEIVKATMYMVPPGTELQNTLLITFNKLSQETANLSVQFEAQKRKTKEMRKGMVGLWDSTKSLVTGLFEGIAGLVDFGAETEKVTEKTNQAAQAQERLVTSIKRATMAQDTPQVTADAQVKTGGLDKAKSRFASIGEAMQAGIVDKLERLQKLSQQIGFNPLMAKINELSNKAAEDLTVMEEQFIQKVSNLSATAIQGIGTLVYAMDEMFMRLGEGISGALLGLNSIGDAFRELGRLAKRILADIIAQLIRIQLLKAAVKIFGGPTSLVGGAVSSLIPGFASGGNVPGGMAHIVGEQGPELRIERGPGTIIPNNQLGNLGGGSGPVYVTVKIGDRVILETIEEAKYKRNR